MSEKKTIGRRRVSDAQCERERLRARENRQNISDKRVSYKERTRACMMSNGRKSKHERDKTV